MSLALVPVKRLGAAKSRLRGALGERADELTLAMLTDLLAALIGSAPALRVFVVTPDAAVAQVARACGAEARVADDAGLNEGLAAASAELARPGEPVLVVLGDVAGATPQEIRALFDALAALGGRGAVLAPSRDGGTAALLRAPHEAMATRFGTGSAAAHRALAEASGLAFRELALPALAIDLDRPEDLAVLLATDSAAAPRTRALLQRLGYRAASSEAR
ncbi:MAG TPA: 2-phospho-L-lactate guanylyltransferase [Myxococcota bacterium]